MMDSNRKTGIFLVASPCQPFRRCAGSGEYDDRLVVIKLLENPI
jgi:hypothetical protein